MNIIKLSSISCPEAAPFTSLTEAQLRHAGGGNGLFIAESIKVIISALEAGYSPHSLLTDRKHLRDLELQVGFLLDGTPVYTAPSDMLESITGFSLSRGVLCAMERITLPPVESVLTNARRVAVLEGIGDPTNTGAIFRSAAALGMDAVLVSSSCCDPLHRRSARVSMGTVFKIPWTVIPCRADNRKSVDIAPLKQAGFTIAATALTEDSVSICDSRLQMEERLAVLMGSEGNGLEPQTVYESDYTVKIPMSHGVDSLNVAAASALFFWELSKKSSK